MELDLAHLERRGVRVTHEIAHQRAVVLHPLGPGAIGNPSRLDHGGVVSHVIHDPHEPVIENMERHAEDRIQRWNRCSVEDLRSAYRATACPTNHIGIVSIIRHGTFPSRGATSPAASPGAIALWCHSRCSAGRHAEVRRCSAICS